MGVSPPSDLFAGSGGLSLGMEQMDGIRFINRKAFVNGKQVGSK
jgi:hypothetical protein